MTSTGGTARLVRAAPYLLVPDVDAAGAYYQEVLGFRCEYAAGTPAEFAIYGRDNAVLMLRRAPDPGRITPNERQGGTWDVFCWVDRLDPLFQELEARGAKVVYPPTVQPYGMREFAVRDPTGYVVGFGEEWPPGAAPIREE